MDKKSKTISEMILKKSSKNILRAKIQISSLARNVVK